MLRILPREYRRHQLLLGASLLALSTTPFITTHAVAQPNPCTAITSDTSLSNSDTCVNWNGGNITVDINTTVTGSSTASVISISSGNSGNTLTNNGEILNQDNTVISNSGNVTKIDNTGIISASSSNNAISNAGTITNITNSGTIKAIDSAYAIYNSGNISTLTNSGEISSGSSTAIFNNSTISAITNTGKISGNYALINNNTASITSIDNKGTMTANGDAVTNGSNNNIGSILNSGTIHSDTKYAITNKNGATIESISNSGTISSDDRDAIKNNFNGTINTISNSGRIIADDTGINNDGSIDFIENTGTGYISGNTYGISAINGSITTLTNSGTITGGNAAIFVQASGGQGTITTLNNSGLISSNGDAIRTESISVQSSIETIINSGTIAGSINNGSTNGLLINGSTIPNSFGTLTGSSGSISSGAIGSITHKQADLTFAGGNLLLNDNIDVTGHSVKNTGATLKLVNAISIIGDYTQSAGGLISQVNGSINGQLDVTGNATINGTTTLVISGNNLKAGDSYTIVGASGTGSYSIASASVTGTNGLNATTSTSNNDLIITLASGGPKYTAPANIDGGTGKGFGSVLDTINGESSSEAQAFQNDVLAAIDSLPSTARGSAIRQLAPADAATNQQISSQSNNIVFGAIETRQQLAMNEGTPYAGAGKAAGGGTRDQAVWGQILGGSAHRAGDNDSDGFTSKSFGLTTGLDHMFTPNMLGGVALSWLRSWTDGSNNSSGSTTQLDSYQLTFYSSYRQNRLNIDGQLGAAWNRFDQERAINFLGNTAKADYDGQQYSAAGQVGYDFALSQDAVVTPFAGLRWLHANNDSYQETGAGAANNTVDSQSSDSVTHEIGAKAAWEYDTDMRTLSPQVSLAWVHDYTSSALETTGQIGGTAYRVESERLPSDGAKLSLGLGLTTNDSLNFRLQYDGELRSGYQAQSATFRAIWNF
ncbi:hypothetical protein CSC3H3_21625 (plasmid) [Thalassospira marina]|uniref:Autotransporter domain-containing protein n=1 Tax=Thalassospira marina TaxID=2048283 RepID=A0ABM6QFW4_9PROT|nr:hypothetical protein CSC3H3_21625 [Thalassospira marina]